MKKTFTRIFAAAFILASPSAFAHDYNLGELQIAHPWSRATLPAAKVGGGYLTLTNKGTSADRLIGGTSSVSGRVEIHSMEIKDNVMTMRPLTDGVEIPAGETIELAPGGFHLMLLDLNQPLKEGERVPLTLEFEHAGTIEVELAVGPAGNSATSHDNHGATKEDSNHKH